MRFNSQASLLARTFTSLYLGHEPKVRTMIMMVEKKKKTNRRRKKKKKKDKKKGILKKNLNKGWANEKKKKTHLNVWFGLS
jgi:hypothetical protein